MTKLVAVVQLPGNTRTAYNNLLEGEKEPSPLAETLGASKAALRLLVHSLVREREPLKQNTRDGSQRTVSNTFFVNFGGGGRKEGENGSLQLKRAYIFFP
jgi:hypothetical protein